MSIKMLRATRCTPVPISLSDIPEISMSNWRSEDAFSVGDWLVDIVDGTFFGKNNFFLMKYRINQMIS